MFWIFGIVFFTQGTYVHIFFSQVFECINPNNKELEFVLSVSIPYKRKLFMIKSSKRKDLTHFWDLIYIYFDDDAW